MTYEVLEKELSEKKLHPIYLFWGNDRFLLDESVWKIKKIFGELSLGINYIIIDQNDLNSIISNIETPAFGYDKKLIIVRNSGLFKKDNKNGNIKDSLTDYIDKNMDIIKDSTVIIFIEEDVNKFSFYKFMEKRAILVEFEYLKPVQLKQKLKRICSLYKVSVSDDVLSYLIDIAGCDMQNLINEIRKLIEHAGSGNEITKKDVDDLAIKQVQAVIFELTDSLVDKKVSKALDILDNLLYQKEPIQKILVTLYNHLKKVYLTKLSIKYGEDIIKTLELKPNQVFLVSKYKRQASVFTEEELKQILKEIQELDYKYKVGDIDAVIGLKTILCKNYS